MELTKHVTQEDMTRYSLEGNIHSSPCVAQRSGLDRTVAQGMMTLAYASELMTRIHGPVWLERGEIQVKFIGLLYAGDTVTLRAAATDAGHEVEATNQAGAPVMVGTANLGA